MLIAAHENMAVTVGLMVADGQRTSETSVSTPYGSFYAVDGPVSRRRYHVARLMPAASHGLALAIDSAS